MTTSPGALRCSQPKPADGRALLHPRDEATDLELLALCASEAALQHRVVNLATEVDAYRELALAAIQALHDVTTERDRIRAAHRRLGDELRFLRGQMMREAAAA